MHWIDLSLGLTSSGNMRIYSFQSNLIAKSIGFSPELQLMQVRIKAAVLQ